jgi:uncharacterized DUF497 family protein
MRYEFYLDPESEQPHFNRHGVDQNEVIEVFENTGLRWHNGEGKWILIGKTRSGRFLQVVYLVLEENPPATFVITAYTPKKELIAAYRRHMKKRNR